jgi:hypothetical protein
MSSCSLLPALCFGKDRNHDDPRLIVKWKQRWWKPRSDCETAGVFGYWRAPEDGKEEQCYDIEGNIYIQIIRTDLWSNEAIDINPLIQETINYNAVKWIHVVLNKEPNV